MKNNHYLLFLRTLLINALILSFEINLVTASLTSESILKIEQAITGDDNHKRAEFEFKEGDSDIFFKYNSSNFPSNLITSFRIEFDNYGTEISNYKVLCTNLELSKPDSDIISILRSLKDSDSACIDGFKKNGLYDTIVKLDNDKQVLAIMLQNNNNVKFNGRLNLRINERILKTDEKKPNDAETYTLVPYSINVTSFREIQTSKILLYSNTHSLNIFYAGNNNYPNKLFSGNILNIYTNSNQIRQKYHNAYIMTLIVNPSETNTNEDFKFEVNLYKSNYLLDYYVSSNSNGRPLNKPLLINMTECNNPYYVIFNYNKEEVKRTLIIDQIYGKFNSLSIAHNFSKNTWEEMINNDMNDVDLNERKYNLPSDSKEHIDVYKIECKESLMFNFYYIDEEESISNLDYGDIKLLTLKPYESIIIPFVENLTDPKIIIEIYNPVTSPVVIIKTQEEETVYQSNTLIELSNFTLVNGITFKERKGSNDTRIIVKVGYPNNQWSDTEDSNIKYNKDLDVYAFKFPMDDSKYNYTYAMLNTSGTNEDDNVKYCFTPNIGLPLKPSSENCYRVANDNPYTLKVYNPLNMYRDYSYEDILPFYVTFKTETKTTSFKINADLNKYNTTIRNILGISNKLNITGGIGSSILSPIESYNSYTFVQIQVCDATNSVKAHIIKALTEEIIVNDINIPENTTNKYIKFSDIFIDSQIIIEGNDNTNIFLKTSALPYDYNLSLVTNYNITFDPNTNTINIESPINETEFIQYTVIIDKGDVLVEKGYTLCDFVNYDLDKMGLYHKTIVSEGERGTIQINFKEAGLNVGEKFDAIIYIEQLMLSQMVFLSDVIQGIVGNIKSDIIHEIKYEYPQDSNYTYITIQGSENEPIYYFTYQPEKILDIPIGALRIELKEDGSRFFTGVYCAFVNKGTTPLGIIEEIEKMIENGDSYCEGGKSQINSKRYNYIFKYEKNKEDNSPKMLVIKIFNDNKVKENFNIYIRKGPGEEIKKTDFEEQRQYGHDENNKTSLIPYIVDLKKIRGDVTKDDYVSKILFYSKNYELQMYYLADDRYAPVKLFGGNIIMALTKPELAIQKYHSTILILFSENLEENTISESFRFHTKMFKSTDQIEYYVSDNSEGRTLNFPLSIEINTCTEGNNKSYYLLDYNQEEELRTLYLEMVFGSYSKARIAKEINAESWNDLITNMVDIENYQIDLPKNSYYIDIIEIECNSPLLINAYYSYENYSFYDIQQGQIVVKDLLPNSEFQFTIEPHEGKVIYYFYYTISLFNPFEIPHITVKLEDGAQFTYSGNTLHDHILLYIPKSVTIINKVNSKTRIIFKYGLNVEQGNDWSKDTSENINGTLFVNNNKYVYKFPKGENKRSYTNIDFAINGINADVENVKFCYSTNLGVAMEVSKENCFRTGRDIPYKLSFINPFIIAKNYETTIDNYYISFRPYWDFEYIKLSITENTYKSPNRNEESIAKLITLDNKEATSILSLPHNYTSRIFIQLKTCTNSEHPLIYELYTALDNNYIIGGNTYFNYEYGEIFTSEKTYVENEIKLTASESETQTVKAFLKHSAIGNYEAIIQDGYENINFDETKNTVIIKKPIINEEFTITVIVDEKGSLDKYTQCDLAFGDKSKMGKYLKIFTSKTSNNIIHFIDFNSIEFDVGKEFDLLVYAEQKYNSKIDFLYPIYKGKVGKISGVEEIKNYTEDNQYVTLNFKYNSNSNYLYYDFAKKPLGLISSLKITTTGEKVTKVGCVFVSKLASDSTIISSVNNAVVDNKNACINLGSSNNKEFNALINANYAEGNNRLVIQVIYGLGGNKNNLNEGDVTLNMKIEGKPFGNEEGTFTLDEQITSIPYIIDLEEIRKKQIKESYVSKILFYSNIKQMTVYYISEQSTEPSLLFDGNIILIYTDPNTIYQKYKNITKMILTLDNLSQSKKIIDVKYFDHATQIQYYYIGNTADGRVLNTPNAIEMTSCDAPYYYILNYKNVEKSDKILHIDTVFGQIESTKMVISLSYNSWNELINSMVQFYDEQIILPKTDYPLDIFEIKCKIPLLLNLYYTDPNNIKTDDLEIGDIIVFSLAEKKNITFHFKEELEETFIYSFNIFQGQNLNPNIDIFLNNQLDMNINKNRLYLKESLSQYNEITIRNNLNKGKGTRIIFKYNNKMELIFEKNEKGIYSNKNDSIREYNLYGYKYDSSESKYNYISVDFKVSTEEDNVKFCYDTNLGLYIYPPLQNCFRVGKNNPYTITILNPNIMYRNYYIDEDINYYVGFRTNNIDQNITIIPTLNEYDTKIRNIEGTKNKIKIVSDSGEISTILTAPKNHEKYIFIETCLCTKNKTVSYQFLNAYNGLKIGNDGNLNNNVKLSVIENPLLETKLRFYNGTKDDEIFIKHLGYDSNVLPKIKKIVIEYNNVTKLLNWTSPLKNEKIEYNIYIDKIGEIKKHNYTLCDLIDITKLGRYKETLISDSLTPNITIDFTSPELGPDFGEFDVIIVAEQLENQKLTFLSHTYDSLGNSDDDGSDEEEEEEEKEEEESDSGKTDPKDTDEKEPKSDDNLKITLAVVIPICIIIIIFGVFLFIRWRKKNSDITKEKIETLINEGELI